MSATGTLARAHIAKTGKLIGAGLLFCSLSGCVSTAWIAKQIVKPQTQPKSNALWAQFVEPFYSRHIVLHVSSPDAGTVDAAVIEPALYNPEIEVTYNIKSTTVRAALNFPDLPPPPETDAFKRVAKQAPFQAYADRLKQWLPTVPREQVTGTILLLPGFGLDKNSLISWALFFADRGWRVVLIDLRGQGASKSPYLTWGVRDTDDLHRLVTLMKHKGILQDPWLYFGISYGAGVALMAGAGAPRPDGIIAIAPWGSAERVIPRFGEVVGGWLVPSHNSPKWVLAEKEAGKLAGINLSDAVPAQSVSNIQAPVLYLGGESDRIATPSEIKALYQMTSRATLKIMPNLPHVIVSVDVPGFCQTIMNWLEQALHQPPERRCIIRETLTKDNVMQVTYIGNPSKTENSPADTSTAIHR